MATSSNSSQKDDEWATDRQTDRHRTSAHAQRVRLFATQVGSLTMLKE